jgi:hypothetical protein
MFPVLDAESKETGMFEAIRPNQSWRERSLPSAASRQSPRMTRTTRSSNL